MRMIKKALAAVVAATMVMGTMVMSAFAADGDYFISGSQDGDNGGDWGVGAPFSSAWAQAGDDTNKMTDNGDGTYSIIVSGFEAGMQYAAKAVSADASVWIGTSEGKNVLFTSETGTVKFTTDGTVLTVADVTADSDDSDAGEADGDDSAEGSSTTVVIFAAVASLAVLLTASSKKFAER